MFQNYKYKVKYSKMQHSPQVNSATNLIFYVPDRDQCPQDMPRDEGKVPIERHVRRMVTTPARNRDRSRPYHCCCWLSTFIFPYF